MDGLFDDFTDLEMIGAMADVRAAARDQLTQISERMTANHPISPEDRAAINQVAQRALAGGDIDNAANP
jgi:hypothetical protein